MAKEDTILVVDDEPANRQVLARILTREGYAVEQADDGRQALDRLRTGGIELVLTDLKMPGMDGLELLQAVRALDQDVELIVMTAYGTVEAAVGAMKDGAYDFITKPLRRMELVTTVRKALEKRHLATENRRLRAKLAESDEVIGRSPPMRRLLQEIEQVAPSEASVLLEGESGTGKGLLARRIHAASQRAGGRLVTFNCAAIPETLLESELFGYEQGAFTGARGRKEGRFDLARGGTLFLDEVTEMSPGTQVKLLRVLQDGEYERVGGTRTLEANCRILSATNRDLDQAVAEGRFREDLYYRLNVIRLWVPALCERPEDVPLLAQFFLARYASKNRKEVVGFSAEALEALTGYRWPGNVRELENVVERAVVLTRGPQVALDNLPEQVRQGRGARMVLSFRVGTPIKEMERAMIESTLRFTGGDKNLAANLLGITARTIYRREAEWSQEDAGQQPLSPEAVEDEESAG